MRSMVVVYVVRYVIMQNQILNGSLIATVKCVRKLMDKPQVFSLVLLKMFWSLQKELQRNTSHLHGQKEVFVIIVVAQLASVTQT